MAERFLSNIVKVYDVEHPVSTDDGTSIHKPVGQFLKLNHHHIHSSYEKSIIERKTIQYIKNRIECLDDYFIFYVERKTANCSMYKNG